MTDIRGRTSVEPSWPAGGMVSRPMDERRWDVQEFTGYPSATVKAGQWSRGSVVRFAAPTFRPNQRDLFMYDPTNPLDWNDGNF